MKLVLPVLLLATLSSCATKLPEFKINRVCSFEAIRYLKNPRNKSKQRNVSPALVTAMAGTQKNMQLCYEDFKLRTGILEFDTCLVVGVDEAGKTEFFNFSSRQVKLDRSFINCAQAVTKSVPFSIYGNNFVLVQAYQFYFD
ncbi:MAG TPA: hypothetical protein VNJ01_16630 [Bacteriovoracaceae bacterium]|nr:hypothetical protein [Bacteriovoracaceae bacterium]